MSAIDREISRLAKSLRRLKHKRAIQKHAQIEHSPRVKAIKKLYLAGKLTVGEIARQFDTSSGAIQEYVHKYNWPRRSPLKSKRQRQRRKGARIA